MNNYEIELREAIDSLRQQLAAVTRERDEALLLARRIVTQYWPADKCCENKMEDAKDGEVSER